MSGPANPLWYQLSAGNASSEGTGLRINEAALTDHSDCAQKLCHGWKRYGLAGRGYDRWNLSMRLGLRGLRRFYSCAICNNRMPPSMRWRGISNLLLRVYHLLYIVTCYCCKANDIRRFYEIRCSTHLRARESQRILIDTAAEILHSHVQTSFWKWPVKLLKMLFSPAGV